MFDLTGKKIWVAGETGMVGCAVLRQLSTLDCTILSAPHQELDLTDRGTTFSWLNHHRPDVVIMAAGKVGGIGANAADPQGFYQQNLSMAQNVIEGAAQAGVTKLLYLGSSCIYPKNAPQPIKESALLSGELEPTNEGYARAKIAGIKLCQKYRAEYGHDFIPAMPCNLYGTHDHFNPDQSHVIPAMMYKMYHAKINNAPSVTLWGTGTPLREFLHVDDLAKGLIHLLQHYSDASPINVGSSQEVSIHDLSDMIKQIVVYRGDIIFDETKPDGTMRKLLDNSRINALGWKAEMPLQQGIERVYQWFLKSYCHSERM